MPAGAVVFGIKKVCGKFSVIRVKQLMLDQHERIVARGLSEQDAEREAMRRNNKRTTFLKNARR